MSYSHVLILALAWLGGVLVGMAGGGISPLGVFGVLLFFMGCGFAGYFDSELRNLKEVSNEN